MQRRHFTLTAAAALALGNTAVQAQSAAPREGKEYLRLKTPVASQPAAGKVEIIEFFWYSCGHCNTFEPVFAAWKNKVPAHIEVRRLPVAFNASFVPQQKLFFALQGMDNFDVLHAKVFDAIHNQKLKLASDEAILDWIGKQGVDVSKFKNLYTSFTIANQARQATQLQNAYEVDGVPSLGIAGRYYTDGSLAGGAHGMLRVAEYLAEQSRKG